jgi:hypothetical protein
MTNATSYVKRPGEKLEFPVDLRDFVADVFEQGVAAEDVQFKVRSDPGIVVTSTMPDAVGLLKLAVTGGTAGRIYQVGVEATTPDGDSRVEMARVRVREPSNFETLPAGPGELPSNTYVEPDYVLDDYVV